MKVEAKELLDGLATVFELRSEYWRTLKEDPHNISLALYVSMKETAQVIKGYSMLSKFKDDQDEIYGDK